MKYYLNITNCDFTLYPLSTVHIELDQTDIIEIDEPLTCDIILSIAESVGYDFMYEPFVRCVIKDNGTESFCIYDNDDGYLVDVYGGSMYSVPLSMKSVEEAQEYLRDNHDN